MPDLPRFRRAAVNRITRSTLRTSFLVALGISTASPAIAQDTPPTPDPTSPPESPAAPPPETAPPPATPPAPTPAPPPPPIVLPETPEPEPTKPAKPKVVKPADITLEETPEEPHAKKPRKHPARPAAKPKEEPVEVEATPPVENKVTPPPDQSSKPSGDKPSDEGESESKKKDDGNGLLGPFRIGILLGGGLPAIMSFGGIIKLTRYFGAGINVGLVPAIRLAYYGEAELSYQEYDVYARIFPFGGAFFAGAGVGYAHAAGSIRGSYNTSSIQAMAAQRNIAVPNPLFLMSEASVRVMVLTPTIGLLHTFGSGFTIGIDAGVQLPIAPSETTLETALPVNTPVEIVRQYVEPNENLVRDTLNTMSRTVIPTLNLRIGWLI